MTDVTVNCGLHMHFIVIIHMGSRMKVDLDEHVHKNLPIYLGNNGVKRSIVVDHIDRPPGKAAEFDLNAPSFTSDRRADVPLVGSEVPMLI